MRIRLGGIAPEILPVIVPALRLVSPRWAARLVAELGRAEYLINLPLKHRYDAALRRGEAHFHQRWNVSRLSRDLAGNHLRWGIRDLLLDGLPDEQASPLFNVRGNEHLDAAIAQGRGVVLLFNHFGAFLMPAHWITRRGLTLRWFTERPRTISRLAAREFESDGPLGQQKLFISRKIGAAEGATAIRRAVRMLQAGMVVQIAGDVRWAGPRTVPARFLGRRYSFTTTWVTLASLSHAPVVPTFCRMTTDGRHELEFLPSFTVPARPSKSELAERVQWFLALVEERVLSDPANSGDYFFWAETDDFVVA